MRDVVGHPADPVHELLDAVEHRVELLGELVEVVAGAPRGDPAREVPVHDLPARAVDRIDPTHRAPAHRERPRDRENEREADTPDEGEPDASARPVDLVHVTPHEEKEPAGKRRCPGAGEMRRVVRLACGPERELDPAVRRRCGVGPAAQVARERTAARGREEIDEGPAGTPSHPVIEHPGERGEPSAAVPVRQTLELPVDRRFGFDFEVHRGRPVDESEHHADRPFEQQEVACGKAKRGAAKVAGERLQSPGSRKR